MTPREAIDSLRNREYKLGGYEIGGPIDCFGLVREVLYNTQELDLLDVIDKQVIASYPDRFLKRGNVVMEELASVISRFFNRVSEEYYRVGDVVFTRTSDGRLGVGIYGGNNYILCVHQTCGTLFSRISDYSNCRGYRCLKRSL